MMCYSDTIQKYIFNDPLRLLLMIRVIILVVS